MKVVIEIEELRSLLDKIPKEDLIEYLEDHGYVSMGDSDTRDWDSLFNKVYTSYRRKVFKVRVKPYSPGTKAWSLLSSIVEEAMVFCKEYGLEYRDGFIEFLDTANELGILHLTKLIRNKYKISSYYGVKSYIDNDPNKEFTDNLYKAFFEELATKYGVYKEWLDPEVFISFVKASEIFVKMNIQPMEAVARASDFWDWTNSPLTPDKLVNKKFLDSLSMDIKPVQVKSKKVKIKRGFERWE